MKDLKSDMMRLWKETFHDTDRYISLVFDAYFTPDNICVRYDGDRLVAALLGVPYQFSNGVPDTSLMKGLYLCGLATRPEYRRQGIMSEMMEEIESRAEERGFDFTFLIPADSHLREYYKKRGYFDFSHREDSILEKAMGIGECQPHLLKSFFEIDQSVVRKLAEWCVRCEFNSDRPVMLHSVEDMVTVIAENENAIFFTNCSSDQEYPNLANVVAVGFPDVLDIRLTDSMLNEDPIMTFSWRYRKIFFPPKREGSILPIYDRKIEVGPYAMARLLPTSKISETAFPSFSVYLLLD